MHFRTYEYLTDPVLAGLFWPGIVTGLALAVVCSVLSVLVVLKRLAFIGQGISHAAFGGAGLAALLGLSAGVGASLTGAQFLVIFGFCFAAALLVGWVSGRGQTHADTAIGIVLVGSMAAGSIMLRAAGSTQSWESFLFGDIQRVAWVDAAIAWGVALGVVGVLWWVRRRMIFWAFDEPAARAWGVSAIAMNLLLLLVLALATVTAMKMAGVVLATALLVLPGAAALRLSRKWGGVVLLALAAGLLGMTAGIVVSFELNWPTGAAIVVVLTAIFGVAWGLTARRG